MILIDSDVLIEISRGRNADLLERWEQAGESEEVLLCSPVTIAELWRGARPGDEGVLSRLFESLVCVPIDQEIGRRAGKYLQQYHKSHALALGDALIAATASQHEARLWTRNRRHYPMKDVAFWG